MRKQKLPKNSGIGTLVLAKAHKGSSQSHLAFLPNSEFYPLLGHIDTLFKEQLQ